MKTKIYLAVISILFCLGCTRNMNFLNPPIEGVNIQAEDFTVKAGLGDTLFYHSGSILILPQNAFVDKDGKVVEGDVQVTYREFSRPIDYFLSGIPMDYESGGKKYSFESSGMFEIRAYKDGEPVFVNPDSKPEINLVSRNNSNDHNIFFLDTISGKWIDIERSIVTDLSRSDNDFTLSGEDNIEEPDEPVKPEKANSQSPVIRIVIDPASFKELLVYDNLKFQIDPDEKNFNPNDTIEEWKRVELQKGRKKGLYIIKFSNDTRTVSFSAKPVLEGKDFDKALKVFEKNRKAYDKEINKRLLVEKANAEQYRKDSLTNVQVLEENKRIERTNTLIEARNREIKQINEANLSVEILRSFFIDGFGIWNCDRAVSLNCIPVKASFKDAEGNNLALTNISVISKSFNGILRFPNSNISLVKDVDNMIMGVYNGRLAFIPFEEYSKLAINSGTKEQTFIMTVVSEENNNYEYIKKFVGDE